MIKYLTSEALGKFKKELDYLQNIKRKEIADRIRHTAYFGDLKENAAYHEAKEAQSFLEGKILKLREIVSQAEVVDKKENGRVQIGSIVIIESNGRKEEFQIVEPEEIDVLCGKISYQSPLGKVLLGKTEEAELVIETPQGKTEYKIIKIK